MGASDLDNGLPQKSAYVGDLSFAHLTGNSENIRQFVLDCLMFQIEKIGSLGRYVRPQALTLNYFGFVR